MTLVESLRNKSADERIDGLFAIERELRGLLDRRMAVHGVTYAQFALLRFITEPKGLDGRPLSGSVRAVDIVRYFGFSPRTVTVAVNKLDDLGYVSRTGVVNDLRANKLALTPKGKAVLAAALREYVKVRQGVFSKLPASHWNALWHTIPSVLLEIASQTRKDALKKRI